MLRTLTLEDHPNIATLENHLKIAVEAGAYARSIITKSWTSLEADITRRETDEQLVTLRQGTQNLRDHYFTLDPLCLDHPLVESHEKVIALTTKFSLGNCAEMVAQALDYIAKNNINVNAETFHINNSDHAILVIGRKPRKRDPELFTRDVFGPETVICDPWANKYYPAKDYLQHLEGYKTNFDAWNKATKRGKVTHSLHPNRHQLVKSWAQPSANEIQQCRQLSVLKVNYRVKAENILATIEKYLEALIKTKKYLFDRYGANDPKLIALTTKISSLKKYIGQFSKTILKQCSHLPTDYRAARTKLRNDLSMMVNQAFLQLQFDNQTTKILFEYRHPNTLKTRMMLFFSKPSHTESDIQYAYKKAHHELSKFYRSSNAVYKEVAHPQNKVGF